jgi:hypothetical protein
LTWFLKDVGSFYHNQRTCSFNALQVVSLAFYLILYASFYYYYFYFLARRSSMGLRPRKALIFPEANIMEVRRAPVERREEQWGRGEHYIALCRQAASVGYTKINRNKDMSCPAGGRLLLLLLPLVAASGPAGSLAQLSYGSHGFSAPISREGCSLVD